MKFVELAFYLRCHQFLDKHKVLLIEEHDK